MLTIEQAREIQDRYQPNPEVRESMGSTSLTALVGGLAVGKTFLMQAAELPIVGTETTRSPRSDDNPQLYRYSKLADMLSAIEAGELVQYGVSLPHHIYGSRIQDYALDEPNVADIWHDAVAALADKGFKIVRSVSVLTPKAQWTGQIAMRTENMQVGDVDRRLSEARHSIRWSLAQHFSGSAQHLLVINTPDTVADNVDRIRAFSSGESVSVARDSDVHDVSREMFETIDAMYKRIGVK